MRCRRCRDVAAPRCKSPEGGTYDTEAIRQFTTNVWSDLMEDPEFKHQDENGLYYSKTPEEAMVKTPQMLAYDKFGIPYPTESYEDPEYMEQFTAMAAGGAGPEQRQSEAEAWLAQQEGRKRTATEAVGAERDTRKVTSALDKAWEEQPERAMTEWDAMIAAARAGQDQTAARDAFRSQYGGPRAVAGQSGTAAAPLNVNPSTGGTWRNGPLAAPTAPQTPAGTRGGGPALQPAAGENEMLAEMFRSQGGLSGGAGPGFNFGDLQTMGVQGQGAGPAAPPMVRSAPWIVEDRRGNVTPFDFAREPTGAIARTIAGLVGRSGLPTGRRATEEDITTQRGKSKEAGKTRSQAQNAVYQATYGDPRLAAVEALARANVLAAAGQTPFRDVMQSRNANARRMLTGT